MPIVVCPMMFARPVLPNILNKRAVASLTILALLSLGLLASAVRPSGGSPQQSSLSLDGSNTGVCINNTSSCTATLTTVHGNDVLIVFADEDLNALSPCTFSISDSAGLSWTARSTVLFDTTRGTQLQEFWASSISTLSSDSVTESISGCGNNYNSIMVFGISGANVNNPFDLNTSLPATALGTSANTSVIVSTSNPTDMIYAGLTHGNNCCAVTQGPGFTMATQGDIHHTEYRIVNSTVTNFPVTFNDTVPDNWITMADAVVSASSVTPIAIDGSSTGGCPNTTSSCSATLTTSHSNDILIVFASEALDLQTSCTFSISDSAGLSWAARSGVEFSNDNRWQLQEFWAKSVSPLPSDAIKESISGCGNNYNGFMVFAVSGANLAAPFDPNGSLPGMSNGFSGGTSVQMSTSNSRDLIYAAVNHGNITTFPTAAPGFTIITPLGTNAVEVQTVNSTLADRAVTFADTSSGPWVSIGDAVQAASSTPPSPSFTISTNSLITVIAGNDATQLATISGIGNFTGTVNLTTAVIPLTTNGPSLTLSSSQVSVPLGSFGSTILTVVTSLNTTAGGYNFTISGSALFGGKTLQQTFVGNMIVQAPPQPDFFLNAYPTVLTVFAGSSATSGISVYPAQPITNSFTVTLTAQLPVLNGLTATFNPSAVTLSINSQSGFSILTVNTLSTTPAGNYTFTVTGRSGTISHILTYSLQVRPPPALTLTPTSGPIGTEVVAHGSGFLAQGGPTEILVTFDDQLVGFTFISTNSFNFTFNVPLAQAGAHTIKATETIFIGTSNLLTATTPFQVTSPPVLSTSLTVGTIYFPGDKAVTMIQVTSAGVPVSSSALQLTVTLTRPDNTRLILNITSLGSGLFRSTYTLSKTALIGTYSIQAVAHLAGATDGSALGSFEVKLPWLSSQSSTAITTGGIASIGAVGAALVSWRMGYFKRPSKKSRQP